MTARIWAQAGAWRAFAQGWKRWRWDDLKSEWMRSADPRGSRRLALRTGYERRPGSEKMTCGDRTDLPARAGIAPPRAAVALP